MTRGRNVVPEHRAGVIGLLAEILRGSVDLHGAACVGHAELFEIENQRPEVFEAATSLCRRCPVRAACWRWSIEAKVDGVTASSRQRPHSYRPTGPAGDYVKHVPTDPDSRHRNRSQRTTDTSNHNGKA
ncbi:WhiB family transcriptional regulator [Williamsia muralis]|uniref:WhiB family transcriptional regulator n=1 Tax=Williamsia marianensis TaxID=85044 RepID=A0ABU4EVV6_WILMA|nr:WhiB family transcriptional regulator [Williamsia muralis]MDV7135376.1 WhiB family transcriptional regulator [Williamsia muralis]